MARETLVVVDRAARVCKGCCVRFATEHCPYCNRLPDFDAFDVRARAWLRRLRRGTEDRAIVPVSRSAAEGWAYSSVGLGLGAALVMMAAGAPYWLGGIAIATGIASLPFSKWGIRALARRGMITNDDAPRGVVRVDNALLGVALPLSDAAQRPEPLRGVLTSTEQHRARRWAIAGNFGGVAARDLLGPPMMLKCDGLPAMPVETESATLVVTGPQREYTVQQLRIGKQLRATGWLNAPLVGVLKCIALHDGLSVTIHAASDETITATGAGGGYRTAPRVPVLRPVGGTIWIEVDG